MTAQTRQERHAFADTLADVGPDAPTLCTGWTAHDLLAHIVVRERRPDSTPGLLLRPFAGHAERTRVAYRDRYDHATLVEMFRGPPWWSLTGNPVLAELVNAQEFFIHHEDVRRAGPDWRPRTLPDALEKTLWTRLRFLAGLARGLAASIVLDAPGYGERRTGKGGPEVRVSGKPSELVLFCFGRQRVSAADLTGPDDLVRKIQGAPLGF